MTTTKKILCNYIAPRKPNESSFKETHPCSPKSCALDNRWHRTVMAQMETDCQLFIHLLLADWHRFTKAKLEKWKGLNEKI